ncbi:MAG: hypothetical protein MHM6MM_002628 [Cercozoa sp. M6MM]
MDWEGQRAANYVATGMMCMATLASVGVGYMRQDFDLTTKGILLGAVLTAIVIVPAWPCFRRNKQREWQPSGAGIADQEALEAESGDNSDSDRDDLVAGSDDDSLSSDNDDDAVNDAVGTDRIQLDEDDSDE